MQKNVSEPERLVSGILGGAALLSALAGAKSGRMLLPSRLLLGTVGSAFLWRGATGHCAVYQYFETNSSDVIHRISEASSHKTSVCINKPIDEVRSYLGGSGGEPLGIQITDNGNAFTCRISGYELKLIPSDYGDSKRTILSAKVKIMRPTPSRVLSAIIAPPAAGLSTGILRNIKAMMETGEIASVEGQPHGERSMIGSRVEQAVESAQTMIETQHREVRA